jgi:hypothetical protein
LRRLRELKVMPPVRAPVRSSADYYDDPIVRERMLEACGAGAGSQPSAAFVAGLGQDEHDAPVPLTWGEAARLPPGEITTFWSSGADMSRSLWDETHLVFMLELDYLNADQPGEPFLRPAEVFFKLEPTYCAALHEFRRLDLQPWTIVTGRGYQFAGVVRLDHPVVDRLAALGEVPSWFAGVNRRRPPGVTISMDARQAAAVEGLGRLIEFAAHRVLARAMRLSTIPVVFNGTIVGSGRVGRECVSIDFSHVGDPLDVRQMRLPFSTYQWHRLRPDIFGSQVATLPPLAAIPRGREGLMAFLSSGRGLDAGIRSARRGDGRLPDLASGIQAALELYSQSRLARFHQQFSAKRVTASPAQAGVDLAAAPPCVTAAFTWPNDRLLKPEHVQHVVRVLMARGVNPPAIARLVQAAYEADHGWGDRWSRLDPRTRADFDVRVFAGMIATGLDPLVDFNCVSAQEKDICPRDGCEFDLRVDRNGLARAWSA